MKLGDVRSSLDSSKISLVKLTGKKIEDVLCYIGDPFSDGEAMIQIVDIILEDGTSLCAEGEHDFPYLANYGERIVCKEVLERLYEEVLEGE